MKKRTVTEPAPLPITPAVMCDVCCRIAVFGTNPPTWLTCEKCA